MFESLHPGLGNERCLHVLTLTRVFVRVFRVWWGACRHRVVVLCERRIPQVDPHSFRFIDVAE